MTENIIPGRTCGSCIACCCFFTIQELEKPAGILCSHCKPTGGCRIYPARPRACRVFFCGYMTWEAVSEDWRPDRSHFVLGGQLAPGKVLQITNDPNYPEAWRAEPYLAQIRQWAKEAPAIGAHVAVFTGAHVIVVTPEGERDLGIVAEDEVILVEEVAGRRTLAKVKRASIG